MTRRRAAAEPHVRRQILRYLDVRTWSRRTEFVVVLLAAFGLPTVLPLLTFEAASELAATSSEERYGRVMLYEVVVLIALGWLLYQRGWTFARVGLAPSWRSTAAGVALAVAAYGAFLVVFFSLGALMGLAPTVEAAPELRTADAELSLLTIVGFSILNPFFEELFVAGYLITVVKDGRGFWPAVSASAALRLLYHLYQGPAAVVGILPLGLVFGYWYARTGRLWPLIVAHALFDAVALSATRVA